jgi:hypothetical protein
LRATYPAHRSFAFARPVAPDTACPPGSSRTPPRASAYLAGASRIHGTSRQRSSNGPKRCSSSTVSDRWLQSPSRDDKWT